MKELSLHILDIVQNSIDAKAKTVTVKVLEKVKKNILDIIIEDDGIGMEEELLKKVCDPFTTTRNTRKVGLGISLFKAAAEQCNGKFTISSKKGVGTKVEASFQYDHIDRVPLGNMGDTITSIILSLRDTELIYIHFYDDNKFQMETREVKNILGNDIPLHESEVIAWIKNYINEGIMNLYGGVSR
jgi:histidine kinase/DNA gyrase B/HSP90-like ATPase